MGVPQTTIAFIDEAEIPRRSKSGSQDEVFCLAMCFMGIHYFKMALVRGLTFLVPTSLRTAKPSDSTRTIPRNDARSSPWLDSKLGITNYAHRGVPTPYL